MPSKIPPCSYQRKTICGYHRRAVAAVKFSPGGTLLGSACECVSLVLASVCLVILPIFHFESAKRRGQGLRV